MYLFGVKDLCSLTSKSNYHMQPGAISSCYVTVIFCKCKKTKIYTMKEL